MIATNRQRHSFFVPTLTRLSAHRSAMKVLLLLTLIFGGATQADKTAGSTSIRASSDVKVLGNVTDFALPWPNSASGSTHELIFDTNNKHVAWVTGQDFDSLAKVDIESLAVSVFSMPAGSKPHGVAFDGAGRFWVSLEGTGQVVNVSDQGNIVQTHDVRIFPEGNSQPINPKPHAITIGIDGKTIWFTGKQTSTLGRINPDGSVEHFSLPSLGAVPIYLVASADGSVWGTELLSNKIVRVMPDDRVIEYAIPTDNSRPIAVVVAPDNQSVWFSQEAGHKVAKIDMQGVITEYPVPKVQNNMILAGLTFDRSGNLWTQSYVDQSNPSQAYPPGFDYIVKLDKAILRAVDGDVSNIPVMFYRAPTQKTVFHRIQTGPVGKVWFTELMQDRLGFVDP